MMEIQVSFCLPIYNVKNYIEDCLQSIDAQNLSKEKYEIICVDDRSTDGSYELLRTLSEKYANVRVLRNKSNLGVSATRNVMIRESRGKYIWFVDPDDMLYPGVVIPVLQVAEEKMVDVFLGNFIKIPEFCKQVFEPVKSITVHDNPDDKILPTDQLGIRMSVIWSGIYRRVFLIENNLFFNENLYAQEDTMFHFEVTNRTNKIYSFDEPAILYRQRATSILNSRNAERSLRYYLAMVEMNRVYKKYYDSGDYYDETIIEDKLLHMRQNLPFVLAAVNNTSMVRNELKKLKKGGSYPFKPTHFPPSKLGCILLLLISKEPGFWIVHLIYRLNYLMRWRK